MHWLWGTIDTDPCRHADTMMVKARSKDRHAILQQDALASPEVPCIL